MLGCHRPKLPLERGTEKKKLDLGHGAASRSGSTGSATCAVHVVRLAWVRARPRRNRLRALALAFSEDAERVHRERLSLPPVLQVRKKTCPRLKKSADENWAGAAEMSWRFVDAEANLTRCEVASLWKLSLRPLNVQDSNGAEHTSPTRSIRFRHFLDSGGRMSSK